MIHYSRHSLFPIFSSQQTPFCRHIISLLRTAPCIILLITTITVGITSLAAQYNGILSKFYSIVFYCSTLENLAYFQGCKVAHSIPPQWSFHTTFNTPLLMCPTSHYHIPGVKLRMHVGKKHLKSVWCME